MSSFDGGLVFGKKGAPGVVAVQEWWGLDFAIQAHAEFIASKGYRVLVPDLYEGKIGVEAEEAQHLMEGLDWNKALESVAAMGETLKEEGSEKVAVTGFCMGGALSTAAAIRYGPGVFACAMPFYGIPPDGLADATTCQVPVLAQFGEHDAMTGFSSPEDAKTLEAKLQKSGCDHEVIIYKGVGHAFMNSTAEGIARKQKLGQGEHSQQVVDEAWEKFFAFLSKHTAK